MIKCIFLAEFHFKRGPVIKHQVPENHISKEMFDAIHNFIITKPELQNRIITVSSFRNKFLGCPVYIEDDKYERNALIFNVCFIFSDDVNTSQYCPVVKKLAGYMTQLEVEQEFLSNPESDSQIPLFLGKVMENLNASGSCHINAGESFAIHLKLAAPVREPIAVCDHDVPVLSVPVDVVMKHQWDLTTQQILHYVDGVAHVIKIAAEADVELNLVKANLQNLLYYRFIQLIPIFQYSNVYTVSREVNKLMEDSTLQQECIKFVAKSDRVLPELRDVFMLYCQFTPGTTVKDLCMRQNSPHNLKVDERKLVQFGVMKGLLRRMHQYPVLTSQGGTGCTPHHPGGSSRGSSPRTQVMAQWLDGKHSVDHICCITGLSHHEVEEKLDADENIVIIWK